MTDLSKPPDIPKLIAVHDYLNIKMDRNNLYIEFLKIHNELIKKEIILNYRISEANKKKLDLFAKVNLIEQKQSIKFLPEQEEFVKNIYTNINQFVVENEDSLINDINKMKETCVALLQQIDTLNLKIPNTLDITYSL